MKTKILSILLICFCFGINAQNKIESTGNVGIGTTSPNKKLHISGAWKNQIQFQQSSGTTNFAQLTSGTDWVGLLTGGTDERTMIKAYHDGSKVIFENGKIGIGTSSPDYNLTLKGQLSIGISDATDSQWGELLIKKVNSSANYASFGFTQGTSTNNQNVPEALIIKRTGNVGIGTTSPDMKLTVKGNIHAEEVKIDLNVPAPDYVFKKNYNLRSIEEVEDFIKKNSHLPEIPSAKEFEQNGIMQAEMDMNLLKKIEELTLYTIQQEKKIKKLAKENESLKLLTAKLLELQKRLEKLEKTVK